jgi:hypothetical protein
LAGALEAKEREHEAAMHVLKESHKLDLAGALEAKEIEHEAAVHALKEAHKLVLAAVTFEAFSMDNKLNAKAKTKKDKQAAADAAKKAALNMKAKAKEGKQAALDAKAKAKEEALKAKAKVKQDMLDAKAKARQGKKNKAAVLKQTETLTSLTEETKQEEECELAHNVKPQVTKEQAPSGAAPTWAASMWMISSTAVAIRLCERLLVKVPTGTSEANKIRQLTKDQIQAVLKDPETVQELVRALMAGIEELNMQDEVDASKLNDKFVADGSGFSFVYGDMVDYHGGLEGASHKHLLLV